MSLQRLTLVLNASYEPINIVAARRALTLVMKGAAIVEKTSAFTIRTGRSRQLGAAQAIPIPSVIRLIVYRKMPRVNRSVSRKTILLRDRYTCQYCLQSFVPKALTLDHVFPRSRGGVNSWENLVSACITCNNVKADRTPAEAGMPLSRKPAPIGVHAKHRLMAGTSGVYSDWDEFLFC